MNESSESLPRCVTSAVIEPTVFTTDISLHSALQWRKVKRLAAVLQCYCVTVLQCYYVTMLQCYNVKSDSVTMLRVTVLQCYRVAVFTCDKLWTWVVTRQNCRGASKFTPLAKYLDLFLRAKNRSHAILTIEYKHLTVGLSVGLSVNPFTFNKSKFT